jgi:DNA polymerase-3 subunit chi
MSEVQVFYFSVTTPKAKIQTLIRIVTAHFLKKEKIRILVPDLKTLDFVDSLLWKEPIESFLPHSVETKDLITLSTQVDPSYPIVFNLCPHPYPSTDTLKTLYELEDSSHPEKKIAFQQKFHEYQKKGWTLCSQPIEATTF